MVGCVIIERCRGGDDDCFIPAKKQTISRRFHLRFPSTLKMKKEIVNKVYETLLKNLFLKFMSFCSNVRNESIGSFFFNVSTNAFVAPFGRVSCT